MRRRLWVVLAALAATPAAAQEGGRIRSGEHGGFSRIVLNVAPTTEWSLELGHRSATVFFPGRRLDFATDGLFVRMPRTRILGVEPAAAADGTAVDIALGCDCRVTTSFVGARYLAIDVHDRDAPARDPAPVAEDDPEPGGGAEAPTPPAADALAAAERMLIDQIERAASQGLIELATPTTGMPAPPPEIPTTGPARPRAGAPTPRPRLPATAEDDDARLIAHLAAAPPAHAQIAATTVFDRDGNAAVSRTPAPPVPAACRADDSLDVARWSDGRPLHAQGADLQRLLVGEFDRPNPGPVRDLARLYIRHGFGAEAAEILRGFDVAIDGRALLADLARVVEGRAPDPDGPLGLDSACPGRHGLWLALAGSAAMLADTRHFASLHAALEDMPPDLRALIGPDLVGRYLDAGRPAEARILHDVMVRPGTEPDIAMRLATGRLAAAERRAEAAEAMLAGLVETNAANAPDALIHLLRTRLDAGGPVPEPWITDLRAAALEHRRAPREAIFRALIAESLARNGDLRGAFATLAALQAEIPASRPAVARLAPRLLAAADPAEVGAAAYAEVALGHAAMITALPAYDAARLRIADALLGLGLPNAALALLAPAVDRGRGPARLTAARAHIALTEPAQALALLAGLAGQDAAALRARAHAQAGDFAAATAALGPDGPSEAALPYAWAAGAWDFVAAAGSPEQAAMAGYMQARGGAPLAATPAPLTPEAAFRAGVPSLESPSLRAARTLVETGREVGGFIGALLDPE